MPAISARSGREVPNVRDLEDVLEQVPMRKHWTGVMKEVGCHLIEDREAGVSPLEVKKLGSRAVAVAGNTVVAERNWQGMTLNSERIDLSTMNLGQRRQMTVVEEVATAAVAAAEAAAVEIPHVRQAVPETLVQSILEVAES